MWSLEGYLKLAQASVQAEQAESFSRLTKSIVAFIRHGHGEDTIDEYGDFSEDDRQRVYERRRERLQKQQENAE